MLESKNTGRRMKIMTLMHITYGCWMNRSLEERKTQLESYAENEESAHICFPRRCLICFVSMP